MATNPFPDGVNVSEPERMASFAGGGVLALLGLRRGGFIGYTLAFIGGTLMYRGATGHCDVYGKVGVGSKAATADVPGHGGILVQHSVTVDAHAEEVYAFWRDYANLPKFMNHLESVTQLDEKTSHWVAKAPLGTHVEWDAETVRDEPGKLIAWRSLEGATVANSGSVRFLETDGKTEVKVTLEYEPPAGALGAAVAKLFGEEPQKQIEDDLGRFTTLMSGASSAGEMAQIADETGTNPAPDGSEYTIPGSAPAKGSLLEEPMQSNTQDGKDAV